MGLFSKKTKELVYDTAECEKKKALMRKMFDEAVPESGSYTILHATETTSKFQRGFVYDTNTTTFYHYILGYRPADGQVVLVQIDRDLTQHSEAVFLDMEAITSVSYEPKYTGLPAIPQGIRLFRRDSGHRRHRQQDHVRHPRHSPGTGTGSFPGLPGDHAQPSGGSRA